jgi:type VI secretion system protein ImpA
LAADIDGCIQALGDLDRVGRERFADSAPNFIRLQDSLSEVERTVRQLLSRKLELDPDPPELVSVSASPESSPATPTPSAQASGAETSRVYEANSREAATAGAVSAARFLRQTEPRSPASYLLLRGFRWGEVRAEGGRPDPRLLEAPGSGVRTQLRSLLLEGKWAQLLEAAEAVMATPVGRAWLDLQRYAIKACEGLGSDYEQVARAIGGALRALLQDVPDLLTMSLMDDMPTANEETRQWLLAQGLDGARQAESATPEYQETTMSSNGQSRSTDRAFDRAMSEVRGGRAQRGIQLLMDELTHEKTPRGRFLRRTQIARIMVDNGLETIAVPILLELLALVDTHKLAEWEAGDLVAEPMALLYRCIEKEQAGGEHSKESLYPRICSLDPLQAMALTAK